MTTSFSSQCRRGGFTLVEIMIGASLGTMVLAGVLSTYLMLLRTGLAASNYAEMDAQARRSFEQLAIDVKMASNFATAATYTASSTSYTKAITLTVPNNYTSNSNQVTYGWDQTLKFFYLVPGSTVPADGTTIVAGRMVLAKNVTNLYFNAYDKSSVGLPVGASSDATTKHVQCFMTLQRTARGAVGVSETIRSASFTMRNKP